ncbi:hypothetical protein [Roseovarius sp. 2305UL8-3]|uniref:hypothetical protein n=1 Tax=Roseovarius conchicola TaxID=3121636 RepID=UPI0035281B12
MNLSTSICATVIIWLASAVQVAGWCLKPVEGGEPQGVEIEQPYRMVREALTIPGYPWLILKPTNRFPLHTIRNGRFEELGAEYPYAQLWSYRDHYVLSDGTVWGVRSAKNSIYVLHPGQSEFEPTGIDGFLTHVFDPNRERLLLLYEHQGLMEWDGQNLIPSPLAGEPLGLNDLLPRYVPDLGMYVAGTDGWLYTLTGTPPHIWKKLDVVQRLKSRDVYSVRATDFRVSHDAGLAVFAHNGTNHIYDISDGWTLRRMNQYHIYGSLFVPETGPFLQLARNSAGERLMFITHDGFVDVDQDLAVTPIPETGLRITGHRRSIKTEQQTLPFVRMGQTIRYYGNGHFYAVPQDTTAALNVTSTNWYKVAGSFFAITSNGHYRLNSDLTVTRLLATKETPSYQLESPVHSATFNGVFLQGHGLDLWHVDGDTVEMVQAADGSQLNRYISDIPGTNSGLILRDDGLHLLSRSCAD